MKNSILSKFFYFSIGSYLNLMIGIITVPIITRLYSPVIFGEYTLVFSLMALLLNIVMLGLDSGISRFFYEVKEKEKLFQISFIYTGICYIIISFLIIFFEKKIGYFLFGKEEKIGIILVIGLFFYILYKYGMLLIQLNQKAKLYSVLNTLGKIFEVSFIIIFYFLYGDNYRGLFYGIMSSIIIIGIFITTSNKEIFFLKSKINDEVQILKYSFPVMFSTILNWVLSNSDKFILKMYTTNEIVGLYSGIFKLVSIFMIVYSSFLIFWTPVSFEKYLSNDKNLVFFKQINEYLCLCTFIACIFLLILRKYIVLFLGQEYHQAIEIFPILILIPITLLITETTSLGITLKNKTRYLLNISIIVTLFNLIFSIMGAKKFGILGVSFITSSTYILFFILKTYYSVKLVKFNFNFFRIGISLGAIYLYGIFCLLKKFNNNYNLIVILILIIYLYRDTIIDINNLIKNMLRRENGN